VPIYEYQCKECGKKVEKIKRNPEAEISCPACGKIAVRTVSLAAVPTASNGGSCSTPTSSGFT